VTAGRTVALSQSRRSAARHLLPVDQQPQGIVIGGADDRADQLAGERRHREDQGQGEDESTGAHVRVLTESPGQEQD
jgi:hypothetical protein